MNADIYNQEIALPFGILPLVLMVACMFPSLTIIAQERTAHTITNNNPVNRTHRDQQRYTTGQARTLSVIPGVTPLGNRVGISNSSNNPQLSSRGNNGAGLDVNDGHQLNQNTDRNINVYNPDSGRNTGNLLLRTNTAKIAAFTGLSANGEYQLTWETVMENEVRQYDVEYSLNNKDFQAAGTISASNKDVYTFNHTIDANVVMFYRLKIISNNGTVGYTAPITVRSTLAKPSDLVTPTIIRDNILNVTLANTYKDLRLINNAGVEVFREYLGGRTGNRIGFNLPTLPAGPYFVQLLGNKNTITQRVIIMQ